MHPDEISEEQECPSGIPDPLVMSVQEAPVAAPVKTGIEEGSHETLAPCMPKENIKPTISKK